MTALTSASKREAGVAHGERVVKGIQSYQSHPVALLTQGVEAEYNRAMRTCVFVHVGVCFCPRGTLCEKREGGGGQEGVSGTVLLTKEHHSAEVST